MTDLSEFLLARIAEDEAAAAEYVEKWGPLGGWSSWTVLTDDEYASMLIDPRRVLAECEARRQIVDLHQAVTKGVWPLKDAPPCHTCGTFREYPEEWPCSTLRFLAEPYADHPQYREEWRP